MLWTEGVGDGGLGVKGRLVGMGYGRRGCGDVEIKEVKGRWVVYERAEDEGHGERAVCRWWERGRRTSHVLRKKSKKA